MSEVVVFSGIEVFQSLDARMNIIRIPQVMAALRQAELWIEDLGINDVSLTSFFLYEDRLFQRDDELRRLVCGVVQNALYTRYIRNRETPNWLLGPMESISILSVVSGSKSMQEWIQSSPWTVRKMQAAGIKIDEMEASFGLTAEGLPHELDWGRHALASVPMLSKGFVQAPIGVFKRGNEQAFELTSDEHADFESAILELVDNHGAFRFTVIGPGCDIRLGIGSEGLKEMIEVIDSVDWDPLLTWVAPALRAASITSDAAAVH